MTLPASGPISFNAINVELGVAGTTQADINQSSYRTLAGVPSGTIALSNFYGKSNVFAFTISSNTTNANLRTLAVNAGWNQSTAVTATIGSGVVVYGSPGLTINGSWPGGVSLINNGYITGLGGTGGNGGQPFTVGPYGKGTPGTPGGQALAVSVPVSITNNNIIGGGGGGGGGSGLGYGGKGPEPEGPSGGGGASYGSAGVAGTWPGQTPGTNGSTGGITTGGNGGYAPYGKGGDLGASGQAGWNPFGFQGAPSPGGAAGACITGNANITWIAFGTRYGSIS